MESGPSRTNNPVINLSKAVKDVQEGTSISVAAAKHNIPISILFNRVSAIRQLKKKKLHCDMQSSTNKTPDKYGLVIYDKITRRFRSSTKCIYVTELYYNAVHFALEGNSLDDTVLNFKVKRKILQKKLSLVKAFLNQQSSSNSNHNPNRNKIMERKNEKLGSLYNVMKTLIENCSLSLPEKFISAIYYTQKGESFENVAKKFSFDITSFGKVVRMLRLFQKLPLVYIKSKANFIQSSLPSIHPSFSDTILTKEESLECLQVNFKGVGSRPYDYETLRTALQEIANGMSLSKASMIFGIPNSTLRDKATKRNIPIIRERRSANREDISSHDEKIGDLLPQKCASPIKSKVKRSQPLCLFCHQPGYREEEFGKLHILNKVIVHYYCLLFSCALEQNGEDDEGILGFLPRDIIKEINRGKKLKCAHCGLRGATIGCSHKNCKRVYHFPCGLDNFSQYIFTDNFSSMCSKHRKYQIGQGNGQEVECPICLETMEADPKHAVWPPCCKRSSWFHRKCIQKLALSAGYFFKCPLCNDKNIFTSEMLRQGIFVPDQDASWELVPNAYQELLERPIRCTAPVCRCPSGRNSDEEGTRWEVLLCYYCGSTGIHISCGNLKPSSTEWHCPTCIAMLEERSSNEQKEKDLRKRKAQALKRKQCDVGDDDIDSSDEENSCHSLSKRKYINSSDQLLSSGGIMPLQGSSSNVIDISDSDDDQIVSVPKEVRGQIIIRELIQNNEPLTDTLQEMKKYAENISQKLIECKIEKEAFLNLLNNTNSSSQRSRKRYIIDETHFQKFETCSLNYDQMRFLRNVFELGFALCIRKTKLNSCARAVKRNPFCRKKRRYKDVLQVKDSLLNLLIKAKSANLLEGDNTWSSYGNRQKNAYFNKVSGDLPSTSNGYENKKSERGECSGFNTSRYVRPIRVMENDEISEDCMWCNMALVPGIHPTTFKNFKIFSVTLSVICTSCLTDNVFHNVFASFASSLPYSSMVKLEEGANKTPEKSIFVDKDDGSETKKIQPKIHDYFSPSKKLKLESNELKPNELKPNELKPMLQSSLKLESEISSEHVDNKEKKSQKTSSVKRELVKREDKELLSKEKKTPERNKLRKYDSTSSVENIDRSSTPKPSSSTSASLQSDYLRNVRCLNLRQPESAAVSISSELRNVKKTNNFSSDSKVSSEPKVLTNVSDSSAVTLTSGKDLRNKDNNDFDDITLLAKEEISSKSQFKKPDVSKTKVETIQSLPPSTSDCEPDIVTKSDTKPEIGTKSDTKPEIATKSDTKPEISTKSDTKPEISTKSDTKPMTLSLSDEDAIKFQLKKHDSKSKIDCKEDLSFSTNTRGKKSDNLSEADIAKKIDSLILRVSKTTTASELRNLRTSSASSLSKTSSESNTDPTSDASPSGSASLRNFRSKDNNNSATEAKASTTTSSDTSNHRQIVLTRSEVLKNIQPHGFKTKNFQSKVENNPSSDNLSKVRISENVKSSSSKEHKSDDNVDDDRLKLESSKNDGKIPSQTTQESNPQSCPPIHQPMSIISSNPKICKVCKMTVKIESLRKKSKVYCPCCREVPTFCDKKHFEYFHSQTHHWATIPPNDGILRPVKKCKVCVKGNFTRFYCPACPQTIGYCSYDHYIQNHKTQKSKKPAVTPSPKKTTSESSGDNKESSTSSSSSSSSSGCAPPLKTFPVSDLKNLKSKVVPQTLTLSSFNFPTASRRIDLNEALGSNPNTKESLKGIRLGRSKEESKKSEKSDKA